MSESPLDDILIGKMTYAWAQNSQIPCIYRESVSSTNSIAKEQGLGENDFSLYLADQQTLGRGRGQNTWTTEKGAALLSTWCFYLNENPAVTFPSRVGMALVKALQSTWVYIPFALKAPNDVYIGDKKCAGLLIETVTQGNEISTFIGLGLNVLRPPAEVPNATSLVDEMPKHLPLLGQDWVRFLDRFFFELTEAAQLASEELSSTDRENLKQLLNRLTLLKSKYDDVSENGDLLTNGNKIPWNQL
ncbi:MAG: biotin--[acetyl-CoA-carboxylase] ligase [Bdellovibrionaceae bacterium]|nr:biotin--[acetyl-CoA-carboxylase] ligase [Pseudobdellovibrionaceae bacterium]